MVFLLEAVFWVLAISGIALFLIFVILVLFNVVLSVLYLPILYILGNKRAAQLRERDYAKFLRMLVKGVNTYSLAEYILFLAENFTFLWLTAVALIFLFAIFVIGAGGVSWLLDYARSFE